MLVNPVTLPPGRAKLSTRPCATLSSVMHSTIGVMRVALAAAGQLVPRRVRCGSLAPSDPRAREGSGPGRRPATREGPKVCGLPETLFSRHRSCRTQPGTDGSNPSLSSKKSQRTFSPSNRRRSRMPSSGCPLSPHLAGTRRNHSGKRGLQLSNLMPFCTPGRAPTRSPPPGCRHQRKSFDTDKTS
jgi:hypothetical protein